MLFFLLSFKFMGTVGGSLQANSSLILVLKFPKLSQMYLCTLLNSIILCSYWFLDVPSEPIDDVRVYHPTSGSSSLTDFLAEVKECNDRPVYIGFGSMEELGFFSSIDCVELLCILNEGMDDLCINILINTCDV